MGHPLVLAKKTWTRGEMLREQLDPGRNGRQLAGSYMSDLCALGKSVILCDFCAPKFNPRRSHYEQWRRDLQVRGRCDDCREHFPGGHGRMFVPEALHGAVNEDWGRRRGRWSRG